MRLGSVRTSSTSYVSSSSTPIPSTTMRSPILGRHTSSYWMRNWRTPFSWVPCLRLCESDSNCVSSIVTGRPGPRTVYVASCGLPSRPRALACTVVPPATVEVKPLIAVYSRLVVCQPGVPAHVSVSVTPGVPPTVPVTTTVPVGAPPTYTATVAARTGCRLGAWLAARVALSSTRAVARSTRIVALACG